MERDELPLSLSLAPVPLVLVVRHALDGALDARLPPVPQPHQRGPRIAGELLARRALGRRPEAEPALVEVLQDDGASRRSIGCEDHGHLFIRPPGAELPKRVLVERRSRHMAYGILFLRVVVGLLLFGHGAQKLFGWFGGHGPRGTAGFFGSLGFRRQHALPMAVLAGLSEAAGLLFALGFLTPFAALAIASVMVVAVGTVHWKNGLWATNGGYEFNLVLWTVAIAVAAGGPGRFSLDGGVRLGRQPRGRLVGRRRPRRLAARRTGRARNAREAAAGRRHGCCTRPRARRELHERQLTERTEPGDADADEAEGSGPVA